MRRLFLALAFCLASAAPSWAAWSYYYPLTYAGASCGSSTSSNFPFLVSFSAAAMKDSAHGGDVQSSTGADIEFFSDSGLSTQLSSELDTYDNVNGIGAFWVQGTCNSSSGGSIYMAVGNASPPARTANPWDANYRGVYHFGNGSTLSLTDSSSGGFGLTNSGVTASATAQIGGSAYFNGSSYAYKSSYSGITASPITIEAWVNFSAGDLVATVARAEDQTDKWTLVMNGPATRLEMDAISTGSLYYGAAGTGVWQHVVGVEANTSSRTAYVNGVAATPDTTTAVISNPDFLLIGGMGTDFWGGFATGYIDELRISNVARSADWIKAEYNNQNAPGNIGAAAFWTYGTRTAVGGGARRRIIVVN